MRRASTFAVCCALIVARAVTGPIFQFLYIWQLVINTGATIVAFLMTFPIEDTQNRDSAALHLKLDELIRINEAARNRRQMFCQLMTMTMQLDNGGLLGPGSHQQRRARQRRRTPTQG